MSEILPNPHRKEVILTLGGKNFAVRPTLDKIMRIESRYGPASPLMQRIARGEATQVELGAIVTVMLAGQRGAPNALQIGELVFQQGIGTLSGQISEFLASALISETSLATNGEALEETQPGNA